jgi:hypothetical protein
MIRFPRSCLRPWRTGRLGGLPKDGGGDWRQASDDVNFTIDVVDADAMSTLTDGSGSVVPSGRLGVSIQPSSPSGGPLVPNSGLRELEGGNMRADR